MVGKAGQALRHPSHRRHRFEAAAASVDHYTATAHRYLLTDQSRAFTLATNQLD